ncbi:MAG: Ig-like domain-containing protein [Calditrichia bacterium]
MNKRLSVLMVIFGFLSIALNFMQCTLPNAPDDTPPVTTIIFPVTDQAVSGTVKVIMGATDNNDIDHLNLYIDGTKVSTLTETPYEYAWDTTPVADNRNHNLQTAAVDAAGNIGFSGAVTVRVVAGSVPDTLAPVITIINPITGSLVSDTVRVIPTIVDDSNIQKVEYYVDGRLNYTASSRPFEFDWIVSNYIDGSVHNLFAQAYDENLNTAYSNVVTVTVQSDNIVDNTPPSVSLLYPVAGSTVSGNVDILAEAEDNVAIDYLELYVDGQIYQTVTNAPWKFQWDTSTLPGGSTHALFVKAYDTNQNQGISEVISVTIQSPDNIPPTVTILYPPGGATYSAGTVLSITADVQDNNGIQTVECYIDGDFLSADATAPYKFDWNTAGYGDGQGHSIYIKAIDLSGNEGTALSTVIITP